MLFERVVRFCFIQSVLYEDILNNTSRLEGADVCEHLSETQDCSGLDDVWGDGIDYGDDIRVSFYNYRKKWPLGPQN